MTTLVEWKKATSYCRFQCQTSATFLKLSILESGADWTHASRSYTLAAFPSKLLSVKRLWRRPSIKPGEDFLKQFVIQVWFKTVDPTCFEGSTIKHIEKEKFVCPLVPLVWITTIFAKFPVFNLRIAASWLLRKRSDLCGAFGCTSRLLGGFSLVLSAFHLWCTSPRDWNPISTAVWELIFIWDGQTS